MLLNNHLPKFKNSGETIHVLICSENYPLTEEQKKVAVDVRPIEASTRDFFGFSISHLNISKYSIIKEATQEFKTNIVNIDPSIPHDEVAFQDFEKAAESVGQVYITNSPDQYSSILFTATEK